MSVTTRTISTPSFNATVSTYSSVSDSSASYSSELNGGYLIGTVDEDATELLTKALADDTLYADDVSTRVCFTKINSIHEQVVAGTNYQYTVEACSIKSAADGQGKCGSTILSTCSPEKYTITVFEQSWTDMLLVSEIKLVSNAEGSSTGDSKSIVSKVSNTSDAAVQSPVAESSNGTSKTTVPKSASRPKSVGLALVVAAALGILAVAS